MAEAAARAAAELVERREQAEAASLAASRVARREQAEQDLGTHRREERRRQRAEESRLRAEQEQQAVAKQSGAAEVNLLQVTVPPGHKPGDTMSVQLEDGSSFDVVVPDGCEEGASILVEPPAETIEEEELEGTESMLVVVPEGVRPGDPFQVESTWGHVFEVCCPPNLSPGDTMEVELPVEPDAEYPQLEAEPPPKDGAGVHKPRLPSISSPGGSPTATPAEGEHEADDADDILDRATLKLRSQAILNSVMGGGGGSGSLPAASRKSTKPEPETHPDADADADADELGVARAAKDVLKAAVDRALAAFEDGEPAASTAAASTSSPRWAEAFPAPSDATGGTASASTSAVNHSALADSTTPVEACSAAGGDATPCSPSAAARCGAALADRFGTGAQVAGGARQRQTFFGGAGGAGGHSGGAMAGGSSPGPGRPDADVMHCRSNALREPQPEDGCRFYVGELVEVLRSSGTWGYGTILEIIHGFETLYKVRLGGGLLDKHVSEDEVREAVPEEGFEYCKGQTVQIVRPNGLLELATITDAQLDRSGIRTEPWYSCRPQPSEVNPQPIVEQVHQDDMQLPSSQLGCAFYVGQLVQAKRKDGGWALARVTEFSLKDYELQYKCTVVRDAVVESWMPLAKAGPLV